MNKFVKIASMIAVSSFAASASAQSFEGFYGQVGVGYEAISPSFSSGGLMAAGRTFPISTSAEEKGTVGGALGLGYMGSVTNDFLLGFGVEFNPITSSSGNYSYGALGSNFKGTYEKQNSYNIFISPATPIGKDGLLYGKVGYTGTSVKMTEYGSSNTTNYTGYSLGAGYKQFISGNLYAFGEVNYANYGNQSNTISGRVGTAQYSYTMTSSANVVNALFGIGYKF